MVEQHTLNAVEAVETGPAVAAPEAVLAFWFGPPAEAWCDAEIVRRQMPLWFGRSDETDATIKARFGATVEAAVAGALEAWAETRLGRLALVLVLDQFTRNIYRGTAAAFSGDAQARAVVARAVAEGDFEAARAIEQVFMALPWEHHEDLTSQAQAVAAMEAAAAVFAVRTGEAGPFAGFIDYALKHQVVVARFGRFPHRNALLGRESTEEERAFLLTPGSSF